MTRLASFCCALFVLVSGLAIGQTPTGYTATAKTIIEFKSVEGGENRYAVWGERVVIASIADQTARVIFADGAIGDCPLKDVTINERLSPAQLEEKVELALEILEDWGEIVEKDDEQQLDEYLHEWRAILALYSRRVGEGSPSNLGPADVSAGENIASNPKVKVKNDTKYTIRISFSGPKSVVKSIAAGTTATMELMAGEYKLVASVPGRKIKPFHSTEKMKNGMIYSHSFFIENKDLGPTFAAK